LPQLPRLIIIFLLKKLVGTSIFKIELKIMFGEKKAPNDLRPPFKKKEKGGEGKSKVWWPMEGSKLGGQWKVPSLVANGR
jgi:hypothetical protein